MNTNIAGTGTPTLSEITDDLYDIFENEYVDDHRDRASRHLENLQLRTEQMFGGVNHAAYERIERAVDEQVLPLYQTLQNDLQKINKQAENRKWTKYAGIGALVGAAIMIIAARRPQGAILGAPIGALAGYLAHTYAQAIDNRKKSKAKSKFFKTISALDAEITTEIEHDVIYGHMDYEKWQFEADQVLANYSNSSSFWEDFGQVKKQDPTDRNGLAALGKPEFREYLQPHVANEGPSAATRNLRFEVLTTRAIEKFSDLDNNQNSAYGRQPGRDPLST